jgi:hypothetical protein
MKAIEFGDNVGQADAAARSIFGRLFSESCRMTTVMAFADKPALTFFSGIEAG